MKLISLGPTKVCRVPQLSPLTLPGILSCTSDLTWARRSKQKSSNYEIQTFRMSSARPLSKAPMECSSG
ncbi:hypothetical protein BDV12DRAFT_177669 [Aspergillus spectabilis]